MKATEMVSEVAVHPAASVAIRLYVPDSEIVREVPVVPSDQA